ncbi:MAG: hypothetical protein ACLP50_22920 [Solirubrobacteraceae bacterium]
MNLRRGPNVVEEEASSPLAAVEAWARGLDRAKEGRDRSIAQARRQGASFREIAGAAGVSVSRVQQIAAAPLPFFPGRSPVTEVDLLLRAGAGAGEKGDVDQAERVFSLRSAARWVQEWETEREFIASSPGRAMSQSRHALSHTVVDLDPKVTWSVVYVADTREVYALQNAQGDVTAEEDDIGPAGALRGPCVLLGHAYSYRLVSDALDTALLNIGQRPGGLAFVYGRLRLLNRLLSTIVGPNDREQIWEYLEGLPSQERR